MYAQRSIKGHFILKIHFLTEGKLLKSNLSENPNITFPNGGARAAFPSVVSHLLTYFCERQFLESTSPFPVPTQVNSPQESRALKELGINMKRSSETMHKPGFCDTPSQNTD